MAELAVRFFDQIPQIATGYLVFGDVERKDLDREVDEREGFPFLLPI